MTVPSEQSDDQQFHGELDRIRADVREATGWADPKLAVISLAASVQRLLDLIEERCS